MILLKITDIKNFMNKLLINDTFDKFLLSEASVKSFSSFTIDGHINKGYYSSSELQDLKDAYAKENRVFSEKMIRWESIKPNVFNLIKGNKTPLFFKISFCMADENIEKFLNSKDFALTINDIGNLTINVKYENEELVVITGVTLTTFTLDKSLENEFDSMVKKFLSSEGIEYDVM